MALIGPMKYLTIGNKTYEIESGGPDIYWVTYGADINKTEFESAIANGKLVVLTNGEVFAVLQQYYDDYAIFSSVGSVSSGMCVFVTTADVSSSTTEWNDSFYGLETDVFFVDLSSNTLNWSDLVNAKNSNKVIVGYRGTVNNTEYYTFVKYYYNNISTYYLTFVGSPTTSGNEYVKYYYGSGSGTSVTWTSSDYSYLANAPFYGTCSTTASTAQKEVTANGFKFYSGSILGVNFSTANTADTPTLKLNGSGYTQSILVGTSTPNGTTNVLKWSANTTVYFMWDGTNFRYITSVSAGTVEPSRGANTWYGTSTTTAATQAKTSTINNFVLTKGALASIRFTYANTYTSAKITLNINSTGAKDVYYNGTVTSSTNTLLWNAGEVLTFMYDGTGYQYIGKSVQKVSQLTNDSGYLTGITSTQVTNALGYTPYNGTTNPNGYITSAKDAYYVAINDTVNWSEVYDAYNNDKLIVGYLMVDGHKIYYYLNAIYFDNVSSPSIQDNMTFSQSYAGLSTNIVGADSWDWDGQNGWQNTYVESITDPSTKSSGQYLQYNGSSWVAANVTAGVSDVQINGTSILSSGTANIVTNTAYNSSSNKIATMSDITNAVPNNSNWVNGSATGSIRTVGSLPESNIYTIGENAVAEGYSTKASGDASHAEGGSTTASEESAHAEGYVTTASGYASHAEGYVTTASSSYAHAEGNGTFASGVGSHAEGDNTIASGSYAHAEGGGNTTASGSYAHAEGLGTLAQRKSQHVFGEYNVADTGGDGQTARGTYVEIVGKGTSTSARSNARTLDWDGNETLAGKLTLGATPTANMDAATKQYVDNAMTVVTLNGTTTSNASFYAPTTAGTSDYFLKSSGSGAPSWSQPIKYGTSLPASGDFTGQVFILIE